MGSQNKRAVFVFTTAYYPLIGGAEIAIQEVAGRLKHKFDFFIFTARMRRDLARREVRPEGTVIRLGFGNTFDKWLMLILAPIAALREQRRDIFLWGMDISQGALAAALFTLLRPRSPFLFTIQYGYGAERLRAGRFGSVGYAYRFILSRSAEVSAISSFLASTARDVGFKRNIRVIPNGAPLERFSATGQKAFDPEHPVVQTVSRLVSKNGVDTLIRALAVVETEFPGVVLRIAGDGPERAKLEALRNELGLRENVTFLGSILNEVIPNELKKGDVFVRMSRSEGMGSAFVEAMAAGLPVIATPVEGIPDVIRDGETGLFARVDDTEDAARAITRLFRDEALRRTIAEKGRQFVKEQFSWATIAPRYEDIFNKSRSLSLLIASPLFPPDISGPGIYAKRMAEELIRKEHSVHVLTYGNKSPNEASFVHRVPFSIPSGFRHLWYAVRAFRLLRASDAVIVLDPVIVGVPIQLARMVRRRPMIMRNEGDFLWEWFSERTQKEYTLRGFNDKFPYKEFTKKERLMYRLARWVFPKVDAVVFNSHWREEIFKMRYPLRSEQSHVLHPAVPRGELHNVKSRTLYFVGRFTRVKNIQRLIRAFVSAAGEEWQLGLIGEGPEKEPLIRLIQELGVGARVTILGPLEESVLREKLKNAYAILLPSLSDVSPNIVLECIAEGTPFLLTKETGFREVLGEEILYVDPLDERDMEKKMQLLLSDEMRARYQIFFESIKERTWSTLIDEWLSVIRSSL